MDDGRIIELLFARSEEALAEISRRYAPLYRSLLREILADPSDVEECESDVLLALWNSIPPNRPDNLAAYISRIARNTGVSRLRRNTQKKRGAGYTVALCELEDCLPDPTADPADQEGERIRTVLSGFLRELEPETRVLFIRRYVYLESVTALAARFSLRENAVSARLHRARKKLRKILEKEDISL